MRHRKERLSAALGEAKSSFTDAERAILVVLSRFRGMVTLDQLQGTLTRLSPGWKKYVGDVSLSRRDVMDAFRSLEGKKLVDSDEISGDSPMGWQEADSVHLTNAGEKAAKEFKKESLDEAKAMSKADIDAVEIGQSITVTNKQGVVRATRISQDKWETELPGGRKMRVSHSRINDPKAGWQKESAGGCPCDVCPQLETCDHVGECSMSEAQDVEVWGIVYDKNDGWVVTLRNSQGKEISRKAGFGDDRKAAVKFLTRLLPEGVEPTRNVALAESTGKQVAATIIKQMGGWGRIKAMTGAKQPMAISPADESEHGQQMGGVSFRFPNRRGPNFVRVILTGRDDYEVTFGRIRGAGFKETAKHDRIYASQLKGLFEKETGLYLSL